MTLEELRERGDLLKQQQAQVQQMFHQLTGHLAENEQMQKKLMEELTQPQPTPEEHQ